ncbi:MAG: four helix bundle protein [Patescibacteria group bacterium]|nr:four helix bundle protein [Patescibacteria group bacterium]
MNRRLPPIAKAARRVLMAIEEAVTRFPRRHKYTIGADLRRDAMKVARAIHRAWRDRAQQLERVGELATAMDELKLSMQLGKDVNAFGSFGEFEALVRLIVDLGKQVGGWLKALHSKGQNDEARAPRQRAQILSACDAPMGATT